MPTEVIMPQMGESIFEGTITKWLKRPGDRVEKDEPLLEISTDKVDAEIPSPAAGVVAEIRIAEGATVQVNTVVAIISDADAVEAAAPLPAAKAAATQGFSQTSAEPPVLPSPPDREKPARAQVEVVMPQLGESIFEGTITKWFKKVGDAVQADQPLLEVSTDKVDAEIPAPVSGILTEICAQLGETVPVNTVVARIGNSAFTPVAPPAPKAATPAAPRQSPAEAEKRPVPEGDRSKGTGRGVRSSPLVRRIAKEHSIDLARVAGTGPADRVTKEDILLHLSRGPAKEPPAAPQEVAALPQAPQPLSRMRAIIGQRMVESVQTSPHAHMVYRVDMTRIARLRERERAGFEQRHGVKLTYMPFIASAAIRALQKFPIVNASLIEGAIQYHANVHLGIAVALEWGLIVPVIREAERRSFASLAQAINDLATRARAKKLVPEEATGSTFTLTNAGVFGGEFGTPIINQPESAILAVGGLRKEPAVLTDAEGNDTIAIRSMQYFCLGFDHRTIDGADAGRFMMAFKGALERWDVAIE